MTHTPTYALFRETGRSFMLQEWREKSSPVWMWIGPASAALFEEFRSKGVKILQEPQNHEWAYEMKFEDPDGNVVWVGIEAGRDLPILENGQAKAHRDFQ